MTGARGISRLPGQATVFYNGEEGGGYGNKKPACEQADLSR